jgi:hypothetical protein
MHISVSTPTEQIEVNAWDELQIDQTDLSTEFAAIPGQIAYWNAVVARVQAVVEVLKRAYAVWFAPLYEAEFNALHQASGKKPNISSAENQVRIKYLDEYNGRKAELDQAETDLKIIVGMVTALDAKLQALMQIAKRQLVEYDRIEPSVNLPQRQSFSSPSFSSPKQQGSTMKEANIEASRDALRRMRQGGASNEY